MSSKIPDKRSSSEATEAVKRSRTTESPDPIYSIGEGSSHPPSSSSFVQLVPHSTIEGLFIGNDNNVLYTRNLIPGEAHNDEILLPVKMHDGTEVEYREWNPFTSNLAAAILSGADNLLITPGSHVLCLKLGDECGTTVSHISDLVGPDGIVYVLEDTNWEPLVKMAEKRFNIKPVTISPAMLVTFRMCIGFTDVVFAAVDNDMEAMFAHTNASYYLKAGGQYVIHVKTKCMGPESQTEAVFACLGEECQQEFKRMKQVTLKPFDEDHAYVIGVFR